MLMTQWRSTCLPFLSPVPTMPTRIVLRENAQAASPQRTPPSRIGTQTRPSVNVSNPSLRKSFRGKKGLVQDEEPNITDFRGSPRLAHYLYVLICSMVMLISVAQFYTSSIFVVSNNGGDGGRRLDQFVEVFGENVYRYKLIGAYVVAASGILIYLVITLAHFDTFLFPEFWKEIFQDGSKGERNLLLGLILFWVAGLFLCTSFLSVGAVQANVYFTTWIAFVSSVMNFGVWRISCGKVSFENLLHSQKRATSFNWFWTVICALVSSLGASDLYANREHLLDKYAGGKYNTSDLKMAMILAWVSVGIGLVALLGNHYLTKEYSVTCCHKFETTFGWRQGEFCLIITMLALYGYIIFNQTPVLNEPSNVYFGVWGTFFSSLFTFGTWLKEASNSLLFDEENSPVRTPRGQSSTP